MLQTRSWQVIISLLDIVESAFKIRMNKVYTNIAFYVKLMLFININNINCLMDYYGFFIYLFSYFTPIVLS